MNTYLKYQPAAVQFLVFLALSASFFLVNIAVSFFFFKDISEVLLNPNAAITAGVIFKFKVAQLASAIIIFLLPALFFGYYSSPGPLAYIGLHKYFFPVIAAGIVVLLFTIQPFIGYLGYLNSQLHFGPVQKYVQATEATYDRVINIFLRMKTTGDLVFNLFIMGLLPAISEELFFRGSFQKVLLRLTGQPLVAILISSAVFALMHGTFLKILPIFALGILLGTLYHITRNLWYNVIIHFINNSFAVLSYYYSDKSELLKKMSDNNISMPWYAAMLSLAVSLAILYFIRRKSDQLFPKAFADEDNDMIA